MPITSTSNIAFVPARNIGGASSFSPPPAGANNIAFVPAGGRLIDLDRFEGPAATSTSVPAKRDRPILLYNDQCEVCRLLSSWVKQSDAEGHDLIDERPIGDDPAALKALDPSLDIWDVYKEIHLLMPDGTVKKGGEAIGEVLKRLPNLKWATWTLDVGVGDVRPFQSMLNGAYKVLDAARPAIGCKSCGGGPVVWWSLPIKWIADAVRALRGASVETPTAAKD